MNGRKIGLVKLTINHAINHEKFLMIKKFLIVKISIKVTSLAPNYKLDMINVLLDV